MFARLLFVAAAWLSVCAGSSAFAYCRTHTEDAPASSCPEVCTERGLPLYWPTPHIDYSFNERGFPALSMSELRRIIGTSFTTWQNVRCDGQSVGLNIRPRAATTPLTLGPEKQEPNENAIVHFDAEAWEDQDLPERAFAITAVWFDRNSGKILGADMMFNGAMDPFGECSASGCTTRDPQTDLQNVATHEFGHFLGLSHSDVPNSTMWCDAESFEVSKRSLSPDDVDGLCDIYPPGRAFPEQQTRYAGNGGSCSLGGPGNGPFAALGMTLVSVLALFWRRRRT